MFAGAAWRWGAFAFDMLAVFAALGVARPGSAFMRLLWLLIAASVGAGFFGGKVTVAGYLVCGLLALGVAVAALIDRRFDAARWRARAVDPILLHAPFRGRWRVVAGGADPRHNHHQVASDQYFAYDFVRIDGPSWDQEILAPCEGTIAWTEDRHEDAPPDRRRRDARSPAGNYVSIETPYGYVILAHLKKGSISILPGVRVNAGDPIGRCGNSGNTRGSHLHIHAQDSPQMDPGIARGIAIAFIDPENQAWLLDYGDAL
ncbi:MAG TPA: M23 family metallopeptidase [Verrucomicrobiae bacterium]|nr:M23 family metallopeptidase [Verrucomicrobiae bacterium]